MVKITDVAAAVIERPGEFLLAQRPHGKPYPGYWEFPGGKIEPGEDARAALVRELQEELGIQVTEAWPWVTRMYTYTHATVRLHFFRVLRWDGEPQPLEDQAIRWQRIEAPDVAPMLPANAPVLAALALPPVMVVSNVEGLGMDEWVRRLGEHAGARSPGTTYSPLVGLDVRCGGDGVLPLDPAYEHAAFPLEGSVVVDGEHLEVGRLLDLGDGRDEVAVSGDGARLMVLGGEPLGEPLVLWWNFVCRTGEEVVRARADWEAGSDRFGEVVGYPGSRIPAPPLADARLMPRS